jgi:hypothetical protein
VTLQERDRRALILLGIGSALIIGWWVFSSEDPSTNVVRAVTDIPTAERRLERLRRTAAGVPGREVLLAQVQSELDRREAGLIQADTAAQAQAQLLQVIRQVAKSQPVPVNIRNTELGQVKNFGNEYGEVSVAINFDAQIEQLLNLISDLTKQKELIATTDMRIGTAHPKQKTMPVRMTISALVRRELVPDAKGRTGL